MLWLLAMIAFVASVIGVLVGQTWWPVTMVIGAVLSIAAIVPWWTTVTPGARFGGMLVNLALLIALLPGWREQVIAFLG
jgi:phage-related protein